MCSSLLGLGGTYVQQCFVCFYPHIYVPHFPVYSIAIQDVITAMSYQHHAGLQPANLVTAQHVLRSRRSVLLLLFVSSFFHATSSFHPVFQVLPFIPYSRYSSYRCVDFGTRYVDFIYIYTGLLQQHRVPLCRCCTASQASASSCPSPATGGASASRRSPEQPPAAAVVSFLFGSPIIVL